MTVAIDPLIIYPERDGLPMSDNTQQFRWIMILKENLECLFADDPQVFVAGDLLWYPVKDHPEIRAAPDTMVVLGRPKGDRGSYQQWLEGNIAPQVVFEVVSPGNTLKEMAKKLKFYEQYGVEEYYIYDPERNDLNGLQRVNETLEVIEEIEDWRSPKLGIRLQLTPESLNIFYPDGQRFLTTVELKQRADQEAQRADQEAQRADQEAQRADQEAQRADQEAQRAELLAAKLRELGINPDDLNGRTV